MQAFANHAYVNYFINKNGMDKCPIILVDGEIKITGRYPKINKELFLGSVSNNIARKSDASVLLDPPYRK